MAPKSTSSSQGAQIFFSVEAGVGYSPTASKKPGGSSSKKTVEREERSGNSHERKKPRGKLHLERKRFKGGRVDPVTVFRRSRTEYAKESEESGGSKSEDWEGQDSLEGSDTEGLREERTGLEEVASEGKKVESLQPTFNCPVENEEKAPPPEEQVVAGQEDEMRGKASEGETCVHCKTGADVKDQKKNAEVGKSHEANALVVSRTKHDNAEEEGKATGKNLLNKGGHKKAAAAAWEDCTAPQKDQVESAPFPTVEEKKAPVAIEEHTPSSKDQAGTAPSPAAEPSNLPKGDDIVVSRKLNGKTSSEEPKAWPAALTTATLTSPFPTTSWESVGHHAGRAPAAGPTDYHSAFRTWAGRYSSEAPEVVEPDTFTYHFDPTEQSPAADLTGGGRNKESGQNGFVNYPRIFLQGRVAVPEGRHVPTLPYDGVEKQLPLYEAVDSANTKSPCQPLAQSSYPPARIGDTPWVTAFHGEHPPPRPPKIPEDMCNGSEYRGDPAGPSIQPRPGSAPPRASPISRPTMIESSARRRSAYQEPSPPPGPSHYDPQLPNHRHTNSHEHTRYTDSRDLQGLADGIYGTRHGHPRPKTDSATRFSYLWDVPNHRYPEHPRTTSQSMESERDKSERCFQGYANPGDRTGDRVRYAADARRTSQTGYADRNYPVQQPIRDQSPTRIRGGELRGRSRLREESVGYRSKSRWQPKRGEKEPAGQAYEEKRGRSTRTAKPVRVGRSILDILDEDDVEAWMDETLAAAEKKAGFVGVMKKIGSILNWLSVEKDQGSELSEKRQGNLKKLLEKVQRFQEDKLKRRWSRDLKK